MDRRLPVRRLLEELVSYLGQVARAALSGWNAFFFSPADPTALGVMRIAVGLLAFWSLLVFGLDLHDYFGSTGWALPTAIQTADRALAWSFWFLVPDLWLRPVWCVSLAVLALYTLGLFSRVTAILAWVIVVSTVRRVPIALYGFDQVLSALALYLAVTGASGQAVSCDRFWRRWRQARVAFAHVSARQPGGPGRRVTPDEPGVPPATVSANLALRLIQLHLVVIYGMAGLAKLQGPSWWDGTALWKTMTTGEFVALNFTALAAWPLLLNLLTHTTLALELLYPVLVWVKIARPIMLAGMLALHLGIAVTSPGLTEFGLAMLAGNLTFVSGKWLRGLATGSSQPAVRILYDGACPRCRSSMALLTAADPDHVLQPIDLTAVDVTTIHPELTRADCMRSMHAITRTGRITAGFDAMRLLAAWLPMFWPLALVGYLPGVAWPGRRVYNWIAATRPRDVPCTDDSCGIHSRTPRVVPRDRGQVQDHHNSIATLADTREAHRP
jgi:predicted DCC family thiol-disulfide oxidoreductase YuxK